MTAGPQISLPIDAHLAKIGAELVRARSLVLQAEPGTGKTTRVPPYLLNLTELSGQEILVLEPRRLAAKTAAERVAWELGERVGQSVGYQYRFETVASKATRLLFVTEGMLMRKIIGDPELIRVGAVVLDEFHERHLHGDVALALLKRLQHGVRRDFKILVMSATLDTDAVAKYLDCPILQVPGKKFEVTTEYAPHVGMRLESQVSAAVERIVQGQKSGHEIKPSGDLLVFLPGMADIRRAAEAIENSAASRQVVCFPLHGEIEPEAQDRAIAPLSESDRARGLVKVILSTNVAETSLTIEGITKVIDSGLHRQATYSGWSGLPSLKTRPTSRASAVQRAGRAGRLAPGRCIRLYSKGDFDAKPAFDTPEIRRAELSQTLLELASLGIAEPEKLEWFEAPEPIQIRNSVTLLYRLGALQSDGRITELGREMIGYTLHPRLARLAIEAKRLGCSAEGATLAAAISEGELEGLDVLSAAAKIGRGSFGFNRLRERILGRDAGRTPSVVRDPLNPVLGKALLTAFPDRVAQFREGAQSELLFCEGGSAPWDAPAFERAGGPTGARLLVVVSAQERQRPGGLRPRLSIEQACAIEEEWLWELEPSPLNESSAIEIVGDAGRVEMVSRITVGALQLNETRRLVTDTQTRGRAIAQALALDLDFWNRLDVFKSLQVRLDFLSRHRGEGFTLASGHLSHHFSKALEPLCSEFANTREAKAADWKSLLLLLVPDEVRECLARLAPEKVQLSRGRWVTVHYEAHQPPWVESRLQDFFGMSRGPSVLSGKVPLTLHLLAPNMRAVQVTSDLSSFWQKHYPELRQELGRRYPRHQWPLDPLKKL